ncbi:MAG TPA: 4Fe-4S dicluster domain-containing protein [Candidatus Krumholzibacteria bacterium]|nr:4Fe-4S dicluster domain-containing protein [Candidatus Krumholzibacteria bacterium]
MVTRREFLKITGTAAGTAAAALAGVETAQARPALDPDRVGVLCDFTLCVGCRRCEWACSDANGLAHGPLESYDDKSVLAAMRRPSEKALTVINRYPALEGQPKPLDVKVNCLHCEHPACVSACPVSALQKNPLGPVTYDASRCIGCRYCMVACPFQIPAYEYRNATTPRVMKCTLCSERTLKDHLPPACVQICPQEALLYGARDALLSVAHDRIRTHPGRYVDHVYGEHEVGGTSWLYLCDRGFQDVQLPAVADSSPAEVTEHIQHGIFRGFSGPLMIFALVSVIMKSAGKGPQKPGEDHHE